MPKKNKLKIKVSEEDNKHYIDQSNKDIKMITSPNSQISTISDQKYPAILNRNIKTTRECFDNPIKNTNFLNNPLSEDQTKHFNKTSKSELSSMISPKNSQKNDFLTTIDQKDLLSSNGIVSTESNYIIHKNDYQIVETINKELNQFETKMEAKAKENVKKRARLNQMDFNFNEIPKSLTPAL